MNIGDFIPYTANSKNYKAHIAGINTYKNSGDVGNHIDFVTDKAFGTAHAYNKAAYNNGLIPVETITGDGTTTEFVLTKEMTEVASVKMGSTSLTGWTYDATTYTLTFAEAPSAGSITVTGTGEKCPWLASDLYHWLNSKAGQVPNGKTVNPAVVHVDYTSGGVYYYLPDTMKAVIVEKRAYLPERYNASQLLTDDNGGSFHDMGKIWVPSEVEVYGAPLYGSKFASAGSCQYPIFHSMENRKKVNISNPGQQISWWHSSPYSGSAADACAGAFNVNAAHIAANSTGGFAVVCFRIA